MYYSPDTIFSVVGVNMLQLVSISKETSTQNSWEFIHKWDTDSVSLLQEEHKGEISPLNLWRNLLNEENLCSIFTWTSFILLGVRNLFGSDHNFSTKISEKVSFHESIDLGKKLSSEIKVFVIWWLLHIQFKSFFPPIKSLGISPLKDW